MRKDGALSPQICGTLSYADGEIRVRRGQALKVYDERGAVIGFQLLDAGKPESAHSEPSSCVISRGDMELLAGRWMRRGQSQTQGLTEKQRAERALRVSPHTLKYLPEMDAVELASVKQACFTAPVSVAGDKAVRVYPRG